MPPVFARYFVGMLSTVVKTASLPASVERITSTNAEIMLRNVTFLP